MSAIQLSDESQVAAGSKRSRQPRTSGANRPALPDFTAPAGIKRRLVTRASVFAACAQLGEHVSMRNVQLLIGGSLRDIAVHVQAWRDRNADAAKADGVGPVDQAQAIGAVVIELMSQLNASQRAQSAALKQAVGQMLQEHLSQFSLRRAASDTSGTRLDERMLGELTRKVDGLALQLKAAASERSVARASSASAENLVTRLEALQRSVNGLVADQPDADKLWLHFGERVERVERLVNGLGTQLQEQIGSGFAASTGRDLAMVDVLDQLAVSAVTEARSSGGEEVESLVAALTRVEDGIAGLGKTLAAVRRASVGRASLAEFGEELQDSIDGLGAVLRGIPGKLRRDVKAMRAAERPVPAPTRARVTAPAKDGARRQSAAALASGERRTRVGRSPTSGKSMKAKPTRRSMSAPAAGVSVASRRQAGSSATATTARRPTASKRGAGSGATSTRALPVTGKIDARAPGARAKATSGTGQTVPQRLRAASGARTAKSVPKIAAIVRGQRPAAASRVIGQTAGSSPRKYSHGPATLDTSRSGAPPKRSATRTDAPRGARGCKAQRAASSVSQRKR